MGKRVSVSSFFLFSVHPSDTTWLSACHRKEQLSPVASHIFGVSSSSSCVYFTAEIIYTRSLSQIHTRKHKHLRVGNKHHVGVVSDSACPSVWKQLSLDEDQR